MSKRIIDSRMLQSDLRSLAGRVRALKQRINKALKDADIYSRIERAFINQGYDYTIFKDKKAFSINVKAHNFCIAGTISKTSIKMGMTVRYDDVEETSSSARCGFIELPISDMEIYLPLIDKMIAEGAELVEKYENLRKSEKSAGLLEIFVSEFMESRGVKNIEVCTDEEGALWAVSKIDDNKAIVIPVSFDNYRSQCEALLQYVRERNEDSKHPDIEVLSKSPYSYDASNIWMTRDVRKAMRLSI